MLALEGLHVGDINSVNNIMVVDDYIDLRGEGWMIP